ncbi:hypothetical protein EVA_09239 [gut metagenome]|uniref:Uncharacterized protein n=1 Tax=gut metagenome TaxID=749906 RepID=J9CR67_9ZZZZ
MMENLSGLPHSHTPPLTPITPSDFLPVRENILLFFPWPKGHRGAYIINIFFPYFTTNPYQLVPFTPIGGHILSIYFFPIFCCYYSLSRRLLQGPRTGFFYNSIPPQVWPRSCSFSGCCTSGTGSSSRAFSTRGRNCSGKCRSRKSSTAPIPSWSRAEIPRSQLKSFSRYSTCTLSCRFSFSSCCRSWASFSFSFIEGIFC